MDPDSDRGPPTVERHVSNILGKLEVKNRAQLAATVAVGDGGRDKTAVTTRRGPQPDPEKGL